MWKSLILAIISGLLLTVAWPTQGFAGLLFFAYVPLLIIERQFSNAHFQYKSLRIFLLAWLAFLIWNALTYSWLSNARPQTNPSSLEIQQAWIAYLFPVILNSLFMAVVFIMFHVIRNKHGNFYGYIFLPALWMSFEKLHLNWDFTWPWLNLGNGFAGFHQWIQWYELTGAFGGTLWVWTSNLILFQGINILLERGNRKKAYNFFAGFAATVLIPIGISYFIYYNYEEKGETLQVALIQPELNPYREKYFKSGDEIVDEMIQLGNQAITADTDIVVTPETSFPGRGEVIINDLKNDPYIIKFQTWINQKPSTVLIAGAELAKVTNATQPPDFTSVLVDDNIYVNRFNSTLQIESGADSIPYYHKSKLVVGVEYFPYPAIFKPLVGGLMLDFGGSTNSLTKSEERTIFRNHQNNAVIAPLICYESVFGEFTADFVKNGANLITVSTNDSWWGNTEGHRQFLAYAKLRAIENRRYVVRAANSGISAFINQRGDVVSKLDYERQGVLTGNVIVSEKLTNYSNSGDLIARIALLLSGILLAYHMAEKIMNRMNRN